MTIYQLYTRLKHMFIAKHWRGAAIHSPKMYNFVREYAISNRGKALISAIGAPVVESVEELKQIKTEGVVILREPFRSRVERIDFDEWYAKNHVVVAHFQGLIVVFFDKKLQKQRYFIRN